MRGAYRYEYWALSVHFKTDFMYFMHDSFFIDFALSKSAKCPVQICQHTFPSPYFPSSSIEKSERIMNNGQQRYMQNIYYRQNMTEALSRIFLYVSNLYKVCYAVR